MPVAPSALEAVEFLGVPGVEDRRALAEVVDLVRLAPQQTRRFGALDKPLARRAEGEKV